MTTPVVAPAPTVRFGCAAPIVPVRDLDASVGYYVRALGFRVNWTEPGTMAGVSRDAAHLMLCRGDQGQPGTWLWIGVGDAAALFAELVARGARVRVPPTNYPWALECQVTDPDGNVLRFGSDPLPGRPFGRWLDTKGRWWALTPDGGWVDASAPEAHAQHERWTADGRG